MRSGAAGGVRRGRGRPGVRSDSRLQTLVQAAVLAVVIQLPSFADVAKYQPRHLALAPLLLVATFAVFASVLVTYPACPARGAWSARRSRPAASWWGWPWSARSSTVTSSPAWTRGSDRRRPRPCRRPSISSCTGTGSTPCTCVVAHRVSPGPGWLLANSPFTLGRVYALMDPVWIAVTAVVLRRTYGRGVEVNLGLAFLCCSPAFFRLLGEGHDIIAIGCSMVLLVVVADRCVTSGTSAVLFGLAVGVVATSRIIYLPLPVLLAIFLGRRDPRRAAVVALVGLGTALGLFAVFSIGVHPYPPLHLFARAGQRSHPRSSPSPGP